MDPLRAHYLKKSLVVLQLRSELADIASDDADALAHLGRPFAPPRHPARTLDLPLLTHLVRRYVLSFPFLAAAPDRFYPDKLQPFVASLCARNLSHDDDDGPREHSRLLARIERTLALFITSAIKLDQPESTIRLSQADLQALERAVARRIPKRDPHAALFRVNIVSVRTVHDRGRVRSRLHEEFLVRTSLSHDRHVCVSRRYGDFKTLADELRKAHPDALVPSPPPKDRTAVEVSNAGPLSREKNRLTLRAYLHTLLATPPFASSPVLRSFLLSGPTRLSPQEQEDARRREEADRIRQQSRKQFSREIGARVDHLREAVRAVKGEVVGRDGLTHVFDVVKVTPHVRDLPGNYQSVLEWARISLASTIFQTFVASDNSPETFANLKRIHGLMPYFLLKAALKISNPVAMIRNVLDIFLAQPFGGRSLLQRMLTSSLTEEAKSLGTYIQHVTAKIDSPPLCEKVRLFVYAPRETQERCRMDARLKHTHLLRVVLMSNEQPALSRSLAERVDRSWRKWAAWMANRKRQGRAKTDESDSEEGPTDEEAWLFEDLAVLFQLYTRLRDREQLISLIFEGITAELLKDIITIFYTPLAQVYRAASISESLGDMQDFINDLIRTVEQTEDLSQSDPSATVQAFIDLVNRHQQSFYSFVHKVHSKGQGLFDSLMKWIEQFLTAMREGIGASALGDQASKISLETLLPAGSEERAKIMEEIDKIMHWHYLNKIAHEERLRSRFRRAQRDAEVDADAEDEATQVLINGVAAELDFGDLVRANADEFAAEGSDEESDEYEDEYDDSADEPSDEGTSGTESDETQQVAVPLPKKPGRSSVIQSPVSAIETTQTTVETVALSRSQTTLPPVQRTRTLSLRSVRSMKLLIKCQPSGDVPPVPLLPVQLEKPLPPHPPHPPSPPLARRRSTGHSELPEQDGGDPPPRPLHKPKKKAAAAQPPELKYIPMLLPIFVEMMRPLLQPQL